MAKFLFTCFLCACACVVSLFTLANREEGIVASEKRKMAEFPATPRFTHDGLKSFFQKVDQYYLDRVPLRDQMLALAAYYPKAEDRELPYEGKEYWLFLGNKEERCVDYLTGRLTFTERDIVRRARIFAKIKDVVNQHNARFCMIVGPNKSTIYPEYLPDSVIPAKKRCAAPFIDSMQEAGIDLFDPTRELCAKKKDTLLYWRQDSHWNFYGCYVAITAAMEHFGLPFLPPASGTEDKGLYGGDLVFGPRGLRDKAAMLSGDDIYPTWDDQQAFEKTPLKMLLIGDSFSGTPCTFFEKVYSKVKRVHYRAIPRKPAEPLQDSIGRYLDELDFKPDVVMWIQVERTFVVFP